VYIQNPRRFAGSRSESGGGRKKQAKQQSAKPREVFHENGTPVKDINRVLEAIKAKGYTQPLYTSEGKLIDNPVAYMKGVSGKKFRKVSGGRVQFGKGNGKSQGV